MIVGLHFLFGLGAVLFAVKKLMSVIQLISASEQLAEMDIKERQEKEKAKEKESKKENWSMGSSDCLKYTWVYYLY